MFALDMVPTPVWRLPEQVTSSYLFYLVMHVLNFAIPSEILQKLLLLAIFFLAGFGMYRLAASRYVNKHDSLVSFGAYFAGLFYVVNPFTYSRFLSGQFAVLFGYALLPWFVKVLLDSADKPSRLSAAKLGSLAALIGIVSIHSLGFIFLFSILFVGVKAYASRNSLKLVWQFAKTLAIGAVLFVVLSSYWLIPVVAGRGATAGAISNFGSGDQQAFATVGSNAAMRLLNVGRLEGFWAEYVGYYRMPQSIGLIWWPALFMILVLVVTGIKGQWRTGQRSQTAFMVFAAFIAILLAAGTLNAWLSIHIPFFAGYREPQKFTAIVALVYSFFAGSGAIIILAKIQKKAAAYLSATKVALLGIVILFSPFMLFGGGRQLAARTYPQGWYTVNEILNKDPKFGKVLFLPWHLYMHFDFAATIIANPATNFFDKPTIVNNDPEFNGSTPNTQDPLKNTITSRILPTAQHRQDLGSTLEPHGITYVILANESDSEAYAFISRQKDLRLVYADKVISLYKIVAKGSIPDGTH